MGSSRSRAGGDLLVSLRSAILREDLRVSRVRFAAPRIVRAPLTRPAPSPRVCWAACGKDPGFTPLSLLRMMQRFARVNPAELDKIAVLALEPTELKTRWMAMSDEAEVKITALADARPDIPLRVVFVDAVGQPGWIGDSPQLRPHAPFVRSCMDVRVDRVDEIADTQKIAAANLLLGQVREPDFDEIQPGGAGRNEVEMEPRMPLQPPLNRGMLVRRVVVDDGMHLDIGRRIRVEDVEERPELLVAMTGLTGTNHRAFERIEGGEQRGRPCRL